MGEIIAARRHFQKEMNIDVNFTEATQPCVQPFEHQVGDYVKIAYLSVLFFIGASINVAAFERLRAAAPMNSRAAAILHKLKTHTNMADLLIIFVYTLSDLCWLTTYDWRAGEALCKMVNFGRMLAFYISSNLVVCIAMNRYFLVFPTCGGHTVGRVRAMILSAWIAALGASLPQLFIWTIVDTPICDVHLTEWRLRKEWRQCCTKWDVVIQKANETSLEAFDAQHSSNLYNATNLIVLFWIPFALVSFFYMLLILRMPHTSCRKRKSASNGTSDDKQSSVAVDGNRQTVAYASKHGTIVVTTASTGTRDGATGYNSATVSTHTSLMNMHTMPDGVVNTGPSTAFKHARTVTIRVSLFVCLLYCVSFLPYVVMQTHKLAFGQKWYEEYALNLDWLNALIVLHSVINPFLYGAFQVQESEREIRLRHNELVMNGMDYTLPPEDEDEEERSS